MSARSNSGKMHAKISETKKREILRLQISSATKSWALSNEPTQLYQMYENSNLIID